MVMVMPGAQTSDIVPVSPVHFKKQKPCSGAARRSVAESAGRGKSPSPGVVTLPPSVLPVLSVYCPGGVPVGVGVGVAVPTVTVPSVTSTGRGMPSGSATVTPYRCRGELPVVCFAVNVISVIRP